MVYLPGKSITVVARVNLQVVLRELGYVFGHVHHARQDRAYVSYNLLLWISVVDGHPKNACRLARVR